MRSSPYPAVLEVIMSSERTAPESPNSHTSPSDVPIGTVRNVLLIRWRERFAERIAVGQIAEQVWNQAEPSKTLIILR